MAIQKIPPASPHELLTLEETAALLKVSKSWIYERTRKGTIPHLKLGKYLRFPLAELLLWIAAQGRTVGKESLDNFSGKPLRLLERNGMVPWLGQTTALSQGRSVMSTRWHAFLYAL